MIQSEEVKRINSVYKKYLNKKYNKWSNTNIGNRVITNERNIFIRDYFKNNKFDLSSKITLEAGCGKGEIIQFLIELCICEENIFGVDIRKDRINLSKKKFPNVNIDYMNLSKLNYRDRKFDFITCFTLFSSILDENLRYSIALELNRVLKKNGIIIFYDMRYNNPFNQDVIGIDKKEIYRLFKNFKIDVNPITILPPLVRRLGYVNKILYPMLSKISFLKTHYIGALKKK